jgi:DNA-directed RNA polymerase subunit M/transcription elongation factor TFIIS
MAPSIAYRRGYKEHQLNLCEDIEARIACVQYEHRDYLCLALEQSINDSTAVVHEYKAAANRLLEMMDHPAFSRGLAALNGKDKYRECLDRYIQKVTQPPSEVFPGYHKIEVQKPTVAKERYSELYKCSHCGNNYAKVFSVQSRSLDEAESLIIECAICGAVRSIR